MRFLFFILLAAALLSVKNVNGQSKNKFKYQADKLTNAKKDNVKFKKLLGNVVFTRNSAIVYCDSAYFYSKANRMEAFGHVRIIDDSVTITAKKLIYEGNQNMALLRKNVVYQKGDKFLYTDFLDYNLLSEVGEFKNNGKLVDETNTLTSFYGIYHSRTGQAFFNKNVFLVSPDFNLRSDTLEYSSNTKVAITKGPTYINNKDGTTVDADGGRYRTSQDQTIFDEGTIETRNYIITGDEIFIDEKKKFYTAKGHVVMTSKKDKIILFGDEAVYDKQAGFSRIYGDPLMKRVMKRDTFFMSADTLVSIENVDKDKERILAYYNILIYKDNMQGKCDSAAYFLSDSIIHMYEDPVLWNMNNQMEADSIDLTFENNILRKMTLRKNAFLVSIDTLGQHNQIKGRIMEGGFSELGDIEVMDINGNGESHYFVLKGDSLVLGMNKIYCSAMRIRFEQNIMRNISFYTQPEAQFIPPHELDEGAIFLEGFDWREDERPELYHVATYYAEDGDKPRYVDKDKPRNKVEGSKRRRPSRPSGSEENNSTGKKQLKRSK
jgi:lipopolysaccharide export system protein LptA